MLEAEKIHLIATRSRDLPACSIVSQPTTLCYHVPRSALVFVLNNERGNNNSLILKCIHPLLAFKWQTILYLFSKLSPQINLPPIINRINIPKILVTAGVATLVRPCWIISRYQQRRLVRQNEVLTSRRCWHDLRQLGNICSASSVPRN
jgi:hypothetical protein